MRGRMFFFFLVQNRPSVVVPLRKAQAQREAQSVVVPLRGLRASLQTYKAPMRCPSILAADRVCNGYSDMVIARRGLMFRQYGPRSMRFHEPT